MWQLTWCQCCKDSVSPHCSLLLKEVHNEVTKIPYAWISCSESLSGVSRQAFFQISSTGTTVLFSVVVATSVDQIAIEGATVVHAEKWSFSGFVAYLFFLADSRIVFCHFKQFSSLQVLTKAWLMDIFHCFPGQKPKSTWVVLSVDQIQTKACHKIKPRV